MELKIYIIIYLKYKKMYKQENSNSYDSNGDIWIGTDSGLFKYIAAQDKIEPVELNINK